MKASATGLAARLLLSAAFAAVVIGAAACEAQDITYGVDNQIGQGSVVGEITTDGHVGVLQAPDIVSWNLQLNGPGATFNLTSVGNQSGLQLFGNDLTATPTTLSFDFSGADGGRFAFQANSPGFYSGQHYYCNAADNQSVCSGGASVVPGDHLDPSAQYDLSWVGVRVIGVAGQQVSDLALLQSIENLAQARTAQLLVNQLESQLLLGLNEQISCGSCGGVGAGFGSYALSGHGRYALNPEWTVLGGLDVGQYREKGADVTLNAGFAAALQYDPRAFGHSRPYVEAGISLSLQNTQYQRSYPNGAGQAVGTGSTRNYDASAYIEAGWVDRITPRDEGAVYATYSRTWQVVGAYAEQVGVDNPFNAVVPAGTDVLDVASLNAQYTHLFGRFVEADLNGGVDWAFSSKSGLRPNFGGVAIAITQPGFVYYQVGGRIGLRVNNRLTIDTFVNGIIAPAGVGSSLHGGFGARWSF